jgi:hypothetical protein
VQSERHKPIWLIPNLLSLDAPLVAVAWLYMFAKTWRVNYLPWVAYASLALVVWLIYVMDRLLDVSMGGHRARSQARHDFHRKHSRTFLTLALAAAGIASVMILEGLPMTIYEYAFIGAIMVGGFFTLSILSHAESPEIPYAKNVVAGLTFAYGTAMLAHAYTGFEKGALLRSPEMICFAVLCILNISAIDLWEHANQSNDIEIKASDELALTLPLTLLGGASLVFALRDPDLTTRPFFYAILTGAALLQVLNRTRSKWSTSSLRVLADAALLVPLLIFMASSKS